MGDITYPRTTGDRAFCRQRIALLERLLLLPFSFLNLTDINNLISLIGLQNVPIELLSRLRALLTHQETLNFHLHQIRQFNEIKQIDAWQAWLTSLSLAHYEPQKSVMGNLQDALKMAFEGNYIPERASFKKVVGHDKTIKNSDSEDWHLGVIKTNSSVISVNSYKVINGYVDPTFVKFNSRRQAQKIVQENNTIFGRNPTLIKCLSISVPIHIQDDNYQSYVSQLKQEYYDYLEFKKSELRTYRRNLVSFLRGAIKRGDLSAAHMLFALLSETNVPPDVFSMYLSLICNDMEKHKTDPDKLKDKKFDHCFAKTCQYLKLGIEQNNHDQVMIWVDCIEEFFTIAYQQSKQHKNQNRLLKHANCEVFFQALLIQNTLKLTNEIKLRLTIYLIQFYFFIKSDVKKKAQLRSFLTSLYLSINVEKTRKNWLVLKLYAELDKERA
jgi:hypothetical protein